MNENFVDYYKILDIDIEATSSEIRNNYLKLAKKNHPDQGGNSEFFQLICKAYECLYNKETRKEYDLVYLKRSFDELKEDELVKFKDEFNEFVTTNVKSINEDKINELFSEIFKENDEKVDIKLNDLDSVINFVIKSFKFKIILDSVVPFINKKLTQSITWIFVL